jgi:hypothetical protein
VSWTGCGGGEGVKKGATGWGYLHVALWHGLECAGVNLQVPGQQTHHGNIHCNSQASDDLAASATAPSAGGRGRQAFFFHRRHDLWHLFGFQVFSAIPFLYELRALLDWTCTATTLSWWAGCPGWL